MDQHGQGRMDFGGGAADWDNGTPPRGGYAPRTDIEPARGEAEDVDWHPLLPLEEDQPRENPPRAIRWIQILREDPDTGKVVFGAGDIDAAVLISWGQVYEQYGGGKYRLRAKCAKKRQIRQFPAGEDWQELPGESKPLLPWEIAIKGPPRAKAQTHVAAEPPAASASAQPPVAAAPAPPSDIALLAAALAKFGEKIEKIEARLDAKPAKDGTEVLVALMQTQSQAAIAAAERQSNQAIAAAENSTKMMLGMLTALKPPAVPVPDNSLTVSLLGIMKDVMGGKGGGMRDAIEVITATKDLVGPAAPPAGPVPLRVLRGGSSRTPIGKRRAISAPVERGDDEECGRRRGARREAWTVGMDGC